ncbi:MAG: hypothetical protein Q7S73_02285 [bacterium]|nr:hypothetical protein [bacterium]
MEKLEIERRFLVRKSFSEKDLLKSLKYRILHITQTYLRGKKKKGTRRIRLTQEIDKRSRYSLTIKLPTDNLIAKLENEWRISKKKYLKFLKKSDPKRETILKKRIVFIWKNQEFELDFFTAPKRIASLVILEIELKSRNQKVQLPNFLPIRKEITNNPRYSNSNVARKKSRVRL